MQTGRDALLAHRPDRNPVLGRCPGNVVGRPDRRGDLYPANQRPERKIDAAVALLTAIGHAMAEGDATMNLDAILAAPVFA